MGVKFYNQLHELSGEYESSQGTYTTSAPDQIQILANPAGWGICDELAHILDFLGCKTIIVLDEVKAKKFSIPFTLFTDVGRYRHVGELVVLYAPLRYWAEEEYTL